MCATISRGQTFSSTETITNTKLHALVDSATITGIVDADISAGAGIQFSKLLASSIEGALLVNLQNVGSGAGKLPFANLNVPFGSTHLSLVSIPNTSLLPLTLVSWVDGVAMRNLASVPTVQQVPYNLIVSSLASGSYPQYNGVNNFVGSVISVVSKSAALWNATIPGSATAYSSFGANNISTTDNHETPVPFAATIKNLYVKTSNTSANTIIVTIRKNTSDTTLTATVATNQQTANDTTHNFTCVAGDTLGFSIVNNRNAIDLSVGVEVDV